VSDGSGEVAALKCNERKLCPTSASASNFDNLRCRLPCWRYCRFPGRSSGCKSSSGIHLGRLEGGPNGGAHGLRVDVVLHGSDDSFVC
jgi:hypothetical protein